MKKAAMAASVSAAIAASLMGYASAQNTQITARPDMRFEHVMNIGSEGYGEGQFKYVEDFDLSSDGHLLVTDAAHAWVQVFDKATGTFIGRFGGKGDDDHNLDKPEGISVAPNGDIYVADYNTGEVKVYDKKHNWRKTFSEYGTEPGQNIKSEFTDIRDGKYYMPEVGSHRVNVFDLSGKFLFSFGETGSGPGQFRAPAGIGFDKHDNLYVGEIGNDRIQVFDKKGNFLTMWGSKGAGNGQFGNIHGIFVDSDTGWVYVADTANNRVQVFRPAS